ncbi:MAG: hypothetical protein WCP06_10520 [Verrucomicrobiota bacterium]
MPCLFKLRHSKNVKTLIAQAHRSGAEWENAGQGSEVLESTLRLTGWNRSRRVVLVREKPALAPIGEQARRRRDHLPGELLPTAKGWKSAPAPWAGKIAVLVTTLDPKAPPQRPWIPITCGVRETVQQ